MTDQSTSRTGQLWQSHLDARALGSMPAAPSMPTEAGRAHSKQALALVRASSARQAEAASDGREKLIGLTSWIETAPDHRRVLAILAGLSLDVAGKTDRQLTETEKKLLRAAARRLKDGIGALAGSL